MGLQCFRSNSEENLGSISLSRKKFSDFSQLKQLSYTGPSAVAPQGVELE